MRKFNHLLCLIFFCFLLASCSSTGVKSVIPSRDCDDCKGQLNTIESLKRACACTNGGGGGCGLGGVGNIRYQAFQESALALGAQAGLAARARVINCQLEKNAKYLDRAFNFQLLLLPCNILPPVLGEGRQELNLVDCETLRLADRSYLILQQAKFVTAPPHWREYLFLDFEEPDASQACMMIKTCEDRRTWNKFLVQGWNDGINQANSIHADNLARLKRDYEGMIRYRKLLAQNMVTAPYIAKTCLGITCDSCGMRVNDQVLRITALPQICTNSKCWRPAITNERTVCHSE